MERPNFCKNTTAQESFRLPVKPRHIPKSRLEAIDRFTLKPEVEIIVVEGGRNEHFKQLHVHLAREGKASRRQTENITRQKLYEILKCVASSTGGRKTKRTKEERKLKTCIQCQLLTGVPDPT